MKWCLFYTSWALFVFCISWNFARDIWTVFEEIKHLRSRAPEKYFTRLYGIDAGLHALSFSLGFNVHKLYLK
jgi:4-hydroxybenzoate polyprenyltransferase